MKHAIALAVILLFTLSLTGCAKPPQEEIDAAVAAVEAARQDMDVTTYAPDALIAAEDRLTEMQAELAIQEKKSGFTRNYALVAGLAAGAKAAGETALTMADEAKRQAGIEATALIEAATTALTGIESKAAAARRLRGIKLDTTSINASIAEARLMLEQASADLEALSYASSRAKAAAVQDRLDGLGQIISKAMLLARKQ